MSNIAPERGRSMPHAPILLMALAILAAGCSLFAPGETREERERLERAGEPFSAPHETRQLPALAEEAPLADVLAYAFHSNAELEMAYFEWAAALERVPQAVSLPDPLLSYQYLFSADRLGCRRSPCAHARDGANFVGRSP